MRKLTFFAYGFIVVILVSIIYFIYHTSYSEQALIGYLNLKNVKKIELGLDSLSVLKIMGEPIERRRYKDKVYFDYHIPEGLSGQISISFDSTGLVIGMGNLPE